MVGSGGHTGEMNVKWKFIRPRSSKRGLDDFGSASSSVLILVASPRSLTHALEPTARPSTLIQAPPFHSFPISPGLPGSENEAPPLHSHRGPPSFFTHNRLRIPALDRHLQLRAASRKSPSFPPPISLVPCPSPSFIPFLCPLLRLSVSSLPPLLSNIMFQSQN